MTCRYRQEPRKGTPTPWNMAARWSSWSNKPTRSLPIDFGYVRIYPRPIHDLSYPRPLPHTSSLSFHVALRGVCYTASRVARRWHSGVRCFEVLDGLRAQFFEERLLGNQKRFFFLHFF